MNYFKNEFKRALFSYKSAIVIFLSVLILLIAIYSDMAYNGASLEAIKQFYDSLDLLSYARTSIFIVIMPIFVSFIFANSYLLELETGFLKSIYIRITKKQYIYIKLIVNSLVAGITIIFSMLLVFIVLYILFGFTDHGHNLFKGSFDFIYLKSRFLYLLFIFLNFFTVSIILSTLSLGISPWIKNRYLTIVFSFFYFIISGTVFVALGLYKLNVSVLLSNSVSGWELSILIYELILIITGTLLFYFGVMRRNKYDI